MDEAESPAGRRRIRVCVLSSAHPATDPRVFHKEAVSLAAAGYTVAFAVQAAASGVREGVQVLAVPWPRSRWLRFTVTVARVTWRGLRWRGKIFHLHDPELLFAGLALKALGRTVVYDVHEEYAKDLATRPYLPPVLRRPVAATVGWFQRHIARCFDAVVAASPEIAADFAGHPRVVEIRNYPPARWHKDVEPADAASRGENRQGFTIAYAGAITADRGLTNVVKALDLVRTPGVRLLLCGNAAPPGYLDELRQLPGFARVDYRGYVPFDDLPGLLVRADAGIVCLLPVGQFAAALPTKLFDYMVCGLPILCSDFPACRRVLESTGAGVVVDPTDPAAIAAGIDNLAEHPDELRQMAAASRRAALERYSWEAEAARLVALYDELAFGRRHVPTPAAGRA